MRQFCTLGRLVQFWHRAPGLVYLENSHIFAPGAPYVRDEMDARLRRVAVLLRLASRLKKVGERQDALIMYPADVRLEKLLPQVTKVEEIMAATIRTLREFDKPLQQKGEGKLGEFLSAQASVGLKSAASLRDAIEKISIGAKALRERTGLPLVTTPDKPRPAQ